MTHLLIAFALFFASLITAQPIDDSHATLTFFKEGDLVFDIGAYVGSRTDCYVKHGARVVAVEPQAACCEILSKRYQNDARVHVVPMGIADHNATLAFYLPGGFRPLATFSKEWTEISRYKTRYNAEWGHVMRAKVITLDELIAAYGMPQLCVLDIENFEYYALMGLTKAIPYIGLEFHQETVEMTEFCIDRLRELGYSEFNFSVANDGTLALEHWASADDIMSEINKIAHERGITETICGELYAHHL